MFARKNVGRDDFVPLLIARVKKNKNQIKPTQQWAGKSHVHRQRLQYMETTTTNVTTTTMTTATITTTITATEQWT